LKSQNLKIIYYCHFDFGELSRTERVPASSRRRVEAGK